MILHFIETILNRALLSDKDALKKLSRIENKIIEIHCADWRMHFYIFCYRDRLEFEKKCARSADVIITGEFKNFLSIFIKGANTQSLFQHPIDIEGDTHVVEVLRDIFKNLDVDCEEKLSKIIGDVAAHKIAYHAKNVKKSAENVAKNVVYQSTDYLHFEIKTLPTKKQVEKFYGDIAKLRDDADRLIKRIDEL